MSSPVPRFSTVIGITTAIPITASIELVSTERSIQYSWLTIVVTATVVLTHFGGFSSAAPCEDAVMFVVKA